MYVDHETTQTLDQYAKEKSMRARKLSIELDSPSIKGMTLHSFKGMESRRVVAYFSHSSAPTKIMKSFVAMSRIKRSVQGSHLIVISDSPELENIILGLK